MAEYIDKTKAVENIKKLMSSMPAKDNYAKGYDAAIGRALIAVREVMAADVQPVDRWISVDEALPIYDGLVLICYNDKRIRLGVYTEDGWDSDEGNPIMEQPDFWVRIPEPPKQ